ncbi:MAG: UDP-3-O-(3-hydroxymyristoyl)glucosamine N-acyltransferase, partial [Holosporales bacterium]
IIEDGVMIDNLVQVAHNVRIGRGSIVVAQVGISGSTEIGHYVQIGGQSGLTGHIKVGNGARIAACSGVMRDIPPADVVGGSPAQPIKEFFRQVAYLKRAITGKGTTTE